MNLHEPMQMSLPQSLQCNITVWNQDYALILIVVGRNLTIKTFVHFLTLVADMAFCARS